MALKDIFKMTKANRYTADGREELIKAQEAVTEDRRYNIGEISEKTGLQKTANGWAKPKNGAGRNLGTVQKKRGPGAIHTPGKGNVGMDKMKEAAEKGLKGQELKEFMTGSKSESKPAEETKTETTAKFETEQENAKYEEGRKGWETVSKERLPAIKEKVQQKIDYYKKYDPYAMLGKRTGLNAQQKKSVEQNMAQAKENLAFFTGQLEGINEQMESRGMDPARSQPAAGATKAESKSTESVQSAPKAPKPSVQEYMKAKQRVKAYEEKYKKDMDDYEYMERIKANGVDTSIFNPMYGGKPKPLEENKSYMEELNKIKAYEAKDAAPRVLTGDTRIRVRK